MQLVAVELSECTSPPAGALKTEPCTLSSFKGMFDHICTEAEMAQGMLLTVFRLTDLVTRARAAVVCKEWRLALQHASLWEVLDLHNQQDAAHILDALPFMRHFRHVLKEVNLEFAAGVTDEHLHLLQQYTDSIQSLNLNACQQLSKLALTDLLGSCPKLQRLQLYWNLNVTDVVLHTLASHCPKLTHLNLSGCKRITDAGVKAVAASCSGLVDVDLTRCLNVTDAGYAAVAAGCPGLQVLRMYACSGVKDATLQALGAHARQLQVVDLCGAQLLTDAGLQALAACQQLQSVNLTWCIQLTDAGVCGLAKGCPSLQLLSLHGNRHITNASIETLAASCANSLHTLDVQGAIGLKNMSRAQLEQTFPKLRTHVVHT